MVVLAAHAAIFAQDKEKREKTDPQYQEPPEEDGGSAPKEYTFNPLQASKVLATDMRLNMALPCRISIYTDKNTTKIGLIKPAQMLASLSSDTMLARIADEVEAATIKMVDEAK